MKRKTYAILSFCLILVTTLPSLGFTQGIDPHKMGIQFTAKQMAKVAAEEIINKNPNDFTKVFMQQILTNLQDHQQREQSKGKGEDFLKTWLRNLFKEDLIKIHQSLNPQDSPDKYFTLEWLVAHVKNNLDKYVNHGIKEFDDKYYLKEFEEARSRAIEIRFSKVSRVVYPSFEKINSLTREGWPSVDQIVPMERTMQKDMSPHPFELEEVQERVATIVKDTLRDIKQQFNFQQDALNISKHQIMQKAITPDDISDLLEKSVNAKIMEMHKMAEQGQTIYPIFSFVKETIRVKGKNIAEERFREYCKNYEYQASREELHKIITQDLPEHHFFEKSLNICVSHYLERAKKSIINAYMNTLPKESQKEHFSSFLNNLVKAGTCHITIKNELTNFLKGIITDIRSDIATNQIREYFESIDDWSWQVPEPTLKNIKFKRLQIRKFKDCIKIPLVVTKKYPDNNLLENTENLVLEHIQKLISEGERAWDGQNSIVEKDSIKQKIKDIIKQEITERLDEELIDEWHNYYQKIVLDEWRDNRLKLICWGGKDIMPNLNDKYSIIFKYFIQKMKDNVKILIAKVRKEEELERVEKTKKIDKEREVENPSSKKKSRSKQSTPQTPNINRGGGDGTSKKKSRSKQSTPQTPNINRGGGDGTSETNEKCIVILNTSDLGNAKDIFKQVFGIEPVRQTNYELQYDIDYFKEIIIKME